MKGITTQLGMIVFFIIMIIIVGRVQNHEMEDIFAEPSQELVNDVLNNPQLIALDSIAEALENEGWTSDAANIIAGFEVDLYDESDVREYALYKAYMED